jgi:hypothetical protein
MFYNKKYLFFITAAIMIFVIYSFIDNFFRLVNINFNFILGFLLFYGGIILTCFLLSLAILTVYKCIYRLILFTILRKRNKIFNFKILWYCFTYVTYIIIFVIFFKATQY